MNNENIEHKNFKNLTAEEQREIASAGGKASVEARRKKKELREIVNALFEREFTNKQGEIISGAELLTMKQFEKASKGDTRAFEVLRDTAGQKPVQQLEVNTINPEAIKEVEDMIKNAKARDSKPTDK